MLSSIALQTVQLERTCIQHLHRQPERGHLSLCGTSFTADCSVVRVATCSAQLQAGLSVTLPGPHPHKLLQHGACEGRPVQHLAAQPTSMQPSSNSGSMGAVGCSAQPASRGVCHRSTQHAAQSVCMLHSSPSAAPKRPLRARARRSHTPEVSNTGVSSAVQALKDLLPSQPEQSKLQHGTMPRCEHALAVSRPAVSPSGLTSVLPSVGLSPSLATAKYTNTCTCHMPYTCTAAARAASLACSADAASRDTCHGGRGQESLPPTGYQVPPGQESRRQER